MKRILKNIAEKLGYTIRSTKFTPRHFVKDENILKITFDHVLAHYMANKKTPDEFFFIQIGAFDGFECDPLYKFIIKHSWQGVMLEPQPAAFEKLSQLHRERNAIKLVNAAISSERKRSNFYVLEGDELPAWAQGMASFDKENIIKHNDILPGIEKFVKATEIDCITFENLFNQFSITHLDLLQIDTESFDAEVIYMFPFEKIKPGIIHFESKHLPKQQLEKLLDHLIAMNYLIAYDGNEDMLAVKNVDYAHR
jgi:FkbM family methyltransferase